MSRRRGYALGWLLLTGFLVLALREIAWDEAVAAMTSARPALLAAAVAANFAIMPLAAWQWRLFLPDPGRVRFGRMMWITVVSSTVSNGGPFLAGHAAGVHLLATRGGTGHATALSVKALDQLAEGFAKLALVGAALLVVPLPPAMRAGATTLLVAVPALALGLLVAARRGHHLERWAATASPRTSRVLGFLAEVARQLEQVRRPRVIVGGVGLAVAQKVMEGAAVWAVVQALGVAVPAWAILLSVVAVNLSTMASVTPANLGVYEASALLAYRLAGVDTEVALGLAVVQHLAYLLPLAGAGWVALAFTGIRSGGRRGTGAAAPEEPHPHP